MKFEMHNSYLGEPLKYPEVGIFQKDPFIATMFGYLHHCLLEISKLLNKVVVFTYNNEGPHHQKTFFLSGFEHRRGFSKKLFGNPEIDSQGMELRWLVRNMRWHMRKYADNLNMYEDVLDDLTGFLFDTVVKSSLGSMYLTEVFYDPDLLTDCIEVGEELAGAIEEAEYYRCLKQDVSQAKQKFEGIRKLFSDYQHYVNSVDEVNIKNLDSKKALDFVQKTIVNQLRQETMESDSDISKKPVTNLISISVMPRLNGIKEDSGFVTDIESPSSTPILHQFDNDYSSMSTPCKSLNPHSEAIDTSMVFIDTPVLHNKKIDVLKNNVAERSSHHKRKSSDVEVMDGSFVLV